MSDRLRRFLRRGPSETTKPSSGQRPSTNLGSDDDGQPINRRLNASRLADRAVDELIGLCRGVLADGVVMTEEAGFLLNWMTANRDAAQMWPANVLYPRIKEMLVDGILDDEEQSELLDLLMEVTGGGLPDRPFAASMSTSLPLTDPAPTVTFGSRVFCLTGRFALGTRKDCQAAVEERGGTCRSGPSRVTDYLVIGTIGSSDWIHSTHGRKIERAIDLREKGAPIAIVSEEHWASFL